MSALTSEMGTGAVSPPEVETCLRTEWPPRFSEKYSRVPSVTRERFEAPSCVICSDESTTGGDSGELRNSTSTTSAATVQIAMMTFDPTPILDSGFSGPAVEEKKE